MLVTIFSDAGYCQTTKAASWGAWAKSERGVCRSGGVLKIETGRTDILEAAAMVNAIKTALAFGILQPGDRMILQTDNQAVDRVLIGKAKGNLAGAVGWQFRAMCNDDKLSYEWRHVKGHSGHSSPRHAVNNYCDRVCRFFLSLERHRRSPKHWPKKPKTVPFGIKVPEDFKYDVRQRGIEPPEREVEIE